MGQCVGMWPAHHSHPYQQRGHPPNIAAGLCAKGKRRFWMVLILQFSVWTAHDTPHLHITRGPELITCSHPPMKGEAWKCDLSIFPVTEDQKYLVSCPDDYQIRKSVAFEDEACEVQSAFKYLDQEHSACRWQGSDSGLSRSSTQAFKH